MRPLELRMRRPVYNDLLGAGDLVARFGFWLLARGTSAAAAAVGR